MDNNNKIEKNELNEKGFIYFDNLFNEDDLKDIEKSFLLKEEEKQDYNEYIDLDVINLLTSEKLVKTLNKLFPKIFHMHDVNLLDTPLLENTYTFHRDNRDRRTGKGPDWINDNYNVYTLIVYLTDSKSTGISLRIIPKSHRTSYQKTLSNFIRSIFSASRNLNVFNFFRKKMESFISENIEYKKGDMVIFHANVYHTGSINKFIKGTRRKAFVARFGEPGVHMSNYLNYILHERKLIDKITKPKNIDQYINALKKKIIYTEIPVNKIV